MLKHLLFALLLLAAAPALAQPPQPNRPQLRAGAERVVALLRARRSRRTVQRGLPRAGAGRADRAASPSNSPPNMARCRGWRGSRRSAQAG